MITNLKSIYYPDGTHVDFVACTHADAVDPGLADTWAKIEKNGARRQYIDADPVTGKTGIKEMYDEDAGEWVEQPTGGGSGGGDSTDFLTDDDIENAWHS